MLLAPGPTLKEADVQAAAKFFTCAVGDSYKLAPHARVIYHSDARWWMHHWREVSKHSALKLTLDETVSAREVCVIKTSGETGFDPDPGRIRNGNNSGYALLSAIAHTAPARVILLGYDMQGEHFFGPHPPQLQRADPKPFSRWINNFAQVAKTYAEMGIDIANCSPDSRLNCFRKATLADELCAPSA